MTNKRNKFKGLILMLGALFTLGLQPLLAQAKTTDMDSHFSVEIVETSDSKVGGEAVQVTVKNITNQTGKHIVAKVDLPKNFADKLGKTSVTETVGTLAAGESKSFIISLSDGSTQVLPTTGKTTSSTAGGSLPATGERIASLALIVGLVLLMSIAIILHKRKLTGLLLALLVVTGGSVAYAATYNHVATHGHQVTVAGQTLAFKTLVSGDFESPETDKPSDDKPTSAKHTLSFDLNYASSETLPSQELVANELASQPTAPKRLGYAFEGWYEKDADTAFDFKTPIQKDITLYAKWTANSYDITFSANGGTGGGASLTSYIYKESGTTTVSLTVPPTTPTGQAFDKWEITGGETTVSDNTLTVKAGSTGVISIKALWKAATFTVNFHNNSADTTDTTSQVIYDTPFSASNPSKTGHTLEGWYQNVDLTGSKWDFDVDKMPAHDLALYAKWTANSYNVTYISNGEIHATQTGTYGQLLTAPTVPTRDSYSFDGWYQEETFSAIWHFSGMTMPDHAMTLYAKWTAETYNITYKLDGGTNYTEAPTTYTVESDTITLGEPIKSHYTFDGWFSDAEFEHQVTEIVKGSSGSRTLYAKWTAETYNITYKLDGGTNYTEAPTTYTVESDTITLGEPIKSHYSFDGWFSDAEFEHQVTEIVKGSSGDTTLYAKWNINRYTYTFDKNNTDSGSSVPSLETITQDYGEVLGSLPTVDRAGYEFVRWDTSATGTGTPVETSTQVLSDMTVYAIWEAVTYKVIYDANTGTGHQPIDETAYRSGDSVTVLAPEKLIAPVATKAFIGWNTKDDGTGTAYRVGTELTPYSQANTFNIVGNTTLYAQWGIYMQDYTSADAAALAINEMAFVVDKRDHLTYKVRKMADGKVWMIEKLRLSGVEINATTSNYTGQAFDLPEASSGSGVNNDLRIYNPGGSGHDGSETDYGYLYNWYTATAKSGKPEMTSGNAPSSIAPKGWRLPSAEGAWDSPTNEFQVLNAAMYASTGETTAENSSDGGHVANWISTDLWSAALSGVTFGGSAVGNQGGNGFYYSSTAYNEGFAWRADIYRTIRFGLGGDSKSAAFAVRCIFAPEAEPTPTYAVTYDLNQGEIQQTFEQLLDTTLYEADEIVSLQTFDNNLTGTNAETNYKAKKLVTKMGYHFNGWNTESDGTGTHYDFNTTMIMPDHPVTLFAEWTREVGQTIRFDNESEEGWRLIHDNSGQLLVVRANALSIAEVENLDNTATPDPDDKEKTDYNYPDMDIVGGIAFKSTFFTSDTTTGYGESKIKRILDEWYATYIDSKDIKQYVLPVDLHLPTASEYFSTTNAVNGIAFSGNFTTISNWKWVLSTSDTRFATEVTQAGQKQSFALSYGDLNTTMGLLRASDFTSVTEQIVPLLDFTGYYLPHYWMRSGVDDATHAGVIAKGGSVKYYSRWIEGSLGLRPALYISLND